MSYSFGFTVSSKEEAQTRLHEEFDKVVASQRDHEKDRPVAEQAVSGLVDCLTDPVPKGKVVHVSVNGSLSGKWDGGGISEVHAANLSAQVAYINS